MFYLLRSIVYCDRNSSIYRVENIGICVCMHACMYVCMYVCVYVCIYKFPWTLPSKENDPIIYNACDRDPIM